ncbi:MAG TPA: DNA-3-methyladenine glycosylase, partial [Actinotalea sp.]|nr:DNA-3-methyladenine glycosylase [Actinotalea sp.]
AERGGAVLVGPRARTETILRVASMLADGSLDVGVGDDPVAQRERLLAVRGIGPWTADYLAMRVLGAPDVLPTGDVALRTGARLIGLPDTPRALADWGARVSPWRSYASLHLWRVAAQAPPARRPAGPTTTPRPQPGALR